MDPIQHLLIVEAIRQTKALYWYGLDTKDWDLFASTMTEDVVLDTRAEQARTFGKDWRALPPLAEAIEAGDPAVIVGRTSLVEGTRSTAQTWVTGHLGAAPVIEVTSPQTAKVIWPFYDFLDSGQHRLTGFGHYHDEFRKVEDRWLISFISFLRLHAEGVHPSWQAD